MMSRFCSDSQTIPQTLSDVKPLNLFRRLTRFRDPFYSMFSPFAWLEEHSQSAHW